MKTPNNRVERTPAIRFGFDGDGLRAAVVAVASALPAASLTRVVRAQGTSVKVRRIISNVATSEVDQANAFYKDVLGLEVLMDLGWIRTYGSPAKMTIQVSVMPGVLAPPSRICRLK